MVQISEERYKSLLEVEKEIMQVKVPTNGESGCIVGKHRGDLFVSPITYAETFNKRAWWKLQEAVEKDKTLTTKELEKIPAGQIALKDIEAERQSEWTVAVSLRGPPPTRRLGGPGQQIL